MLGWVPATALMSLLPGLWQTKNSIGEMSLEATYDLGYSERSWNPLEFMEGQRRGHSDT